MSSAAQFLAIKEGDKCSNCGMSYAACTRRILDRGLTACCIECGYHDTHNARRKLTEDEFKTKIIEYAKLRGWMVVHFRPAWTSKGYRTPIEGDKGFP